MINVVVAAERSEAAVGVNYRHHPNIVELNVVDIFVKIVDCRVFIFNRASHCGFNLTQFLALQMVNFSSLHDDGGSVEVFYQLHSIRYR